MKIFGIEIDIDYVGIDKVLHCVISFAIVLMVVGFGKGIMNIADCMAIGFLVALATGIGKECYDKYIRKSVFDELDLVADIVGIAMAEGALLVGMVG